jgi:predicted RNA-binding protein with PUA-like domain
MICRCSQCHRFDLEELEIAHKLTRTTARNNMRTMMKGDMAFFYHSNCKVPGIVGTMEIVEEHSVDGKLFAT